MLLMPLETAVMRAFLASNLKERSQTFENQQLGFVHVVLMSKF